LWSRSAKYATGQSAFAEAQRFFLPSAKSSSTVAKSLISDVIKAQIQLQQQQRELAGGGAGDESQPRRTGGIGIFPSSARIFSVIDDLQNA